MKNDKNKKTVPDQIQQFVTFFDLSTFFYFNYIFSANIAANI